MNELREIVSGYPGFLPGLAMTLIIAFAARRHVARWLDVSPALAVAIVVAAGIVVSATLTPSPDALAGRVTGTGTCDLSRVGLPTGNQLAQAGQIALNILLFVPLGGVVVLL